MFLRNHDELTSYAAPHSRISSCSFAQDFNITSRRLQATPNTYIDVNPSNDVERLTAEVQTPVTEAQRHKGKSLGWDGMMKRGWNRYRVVPVLT